MNDLKRVGILALQGDFLAHAEAVRRACTECIERPEFEPVEVRTTKQLDTVAGLIIPGGESTTLLNLMEDEPWFDELRSFHRRGGAIFGTCAGAILLAREVTHPAQRSLGLLDMTVQRNAYGRQIDSFETDLEVRESEPSFRAVFIRAPQFSQLGPEVEILASHAGQPVLVRQGSIMAASFHPELTADTRLHREFLEMIHCSESESDRGRTTVSATNSDLRAQPRRARC